MKSNLGVSMSNKLAVGLSPPPHSCLNPNPWAERDLMASAALFQLQASNMYLPLLQDVLWGSQSRQLTASLGPWGVPPPFALGLPVSLQGL